MKKIILTCFLVLPCLFQKARIKLKAVIDRLGLPSPSTYLSKAIFHRPQGGLFREAYLAPAYLAAGVFHIAKRSVFREAYFSKAVSHRPQGGLFRAAYLALAYLAPAYFAPRVFHAAKRSVFREAYFQNKATWIGTYSLILTLLCSSISPTLRKVAQSPPEPPLHRSAVPVSPHSGDTHRGEETLSDTFTQVDYGPEVSSPANYTTSLTTLDGGPTLRSLVLSEVEASDTQHRTSLRSTVSRLPSLTNFGLINPDQDRRIGLEASRLQSTSVPVLTGPNNSRREVNLQHTEAQSLVSNVLLLESKKSSSVPVFSNQINSGREASRKNNGAQSLVSNVLLLESKKSSSVPVFDVLTNSGRETSSKITLAKSLSSCVLCLASKKSTSVPVLTGPNNSRREIHRQTTEAQSLASCVLDLVSSNGLINPDQDMGAGEEGTILQPAPFPVLPSPTYSRREVSRQNTEARSLASCVLDLASNIACAEPSRSIGHRTNLPSQSSPDAVIWGRITEYGSRDQIRLQVYPEYFFDSPKAPGANLLFIPLKLGNLMEGAYPKSRSFQYNLPTAHQPQWISLSLGESVPFVNRFRIDPGDTIQVFLNLESNSLVFAGPAAPKFKLQQELNHLEEEFQVRSTPVLWTERPDQVLLDSTYAAQYQEAKSSAGPLLSIKARNLEVLNELANRDLYDPKGLLNQSWTLIDSYREEIRKDLIDFFKKEIELREWRKYLLSINSHLLFAKREKENSAFFTAVVRLAEDQIRDLQPILSNEISPYSAEMMDLLDVQSRIRAGISSGNRYQHDSIPDSYWNAKMLVRLFYKSFDLIPEAPQYLSKQMANLKQSRYRDWLQVLLDLKGTGKKVTGFEFFDQAGDLRSFDEVAKGNLILLEFWITGCKACLAFNENALTKIREELGKDSRIQVITVSADFTEELWKSSLESGKYTQEEFTNLYTGSLNRKHPFLLQYGISSFPNRILLDGEGKIIQASQVPFLPDELIPLLKTYLNDLQPKSQSML